MGNRNFFSIVDVQNIPPVSQRCRLNNASVNRH